MRTFYHSLKRKSGMLLSLLLLACLWSGVAKAQSITVRGTVQDQASEPIIGANIVIKGSTQGTITNFDGNFSLQIPSGTETLMVSYIGYLSQEVEVNNQTQFNIILEEDMEQLEEVVVVGYGTAKEKDLTSPIATVNADDITAMSSTSPMQSIQGKVPGVTITNSGAPGEGPTVRIRGVGSLQNSDPLYVVDGMFVDDINFLNPNDIESMSILKDASAAAIYGVRAANGVVLITTKGGKKGTKMRVSYDGYYGVQKVTQRLKMANSEQYANVMNASNNADYAAVIQKSIDMYGGENGIPAVSTDWYDVLLRDSAPIQSHNIGLNGGTEKATYSFGVSYFDQEGMMDATGMYKRLGLRGKADFDVSDNLKIGMSMNLTNEQRQVDDGNAWFNAYTNSPIYPVMDNSLSDDRAYPVKFANPHDLGFSTYYTNPAAVAYYRGDDISKATRFLPTIYAELRPFSAKDIVFRSAMNMDFRFNRSRKYTPEYIAGDNIQQINLLDKSHTWNSNYVWDNTVTWYNTLGEHNLNVMAGFSARQQQWYTLRGTAQGTTLPDYIDGADAATTTAYDDGERFHGLSAFTRVSYDYKERYLLSLTMRADGSSKYQQTWGYFPSIGAGWIISDEPFMADVADKGVSFLKLRASWGRLGNDHVTHNDGFATVSSGGLDDSGIFGDAILVPGMINQTNYTDLKWEVVEELNFGLDSRFLNDRLSFEADYFIRDTKNLVIRTTLPNGNGTLLQNTGSVRNSGLELVMNWSDQIGTDFSYSVGGNFTKLHNEVTSLADQPYIMTGSAEFPQRSEVGSPIYSFYGWKTDGVYQNQAEIDADPIAVANGLKPGDFRYVDTNGDGVLDNDDRQLLGDYQPDFTYGLNMNLQYKGWSLAAAFQGVGGVTIFNRRRADINKHGLNNLDANLAENLWSGEGSTNAYPSAEGLFNTWNNGKFNDFFLEDASYFRIQNVRLAYSLPKSALDKLRMSAAQIYVNADRPYTFFNTNGFTPEVIDGVDQSVYPIPAVFSLGANLTF
ncbi:TonB-dependent receptor [Limibacter armeniacum]|uniref:SusC/RagA family TonB-linked outer membrane protein n=1 Tax=Limibacter armeniacum TaxID=466084 RepID=UPI002FE5EBA3